MESSSLLWRRESEGNDKRGRESAGPGESERERGRVSAGSNELRGEGESENAPSGVASTSSTAPQSTSGFLPNPYVSSRFFPTSASAFGPTVLGPPLGVVVPEAEAETAITLLVVDEDEPVMVFDRLGAFGRGAGGVEVGRACGEVEG